MIAPPLPANEAARLSALERYDILDTEREQAYDDFTKLAAHVCGTPMALIGLIDDRRQWFKSKINMDGDETPRELTFCGHTLVDNQTLVVPDTIQDQRFHDHPSVTGAPRIRFYAGAPIVTHDGYGLGTLCVIDDKPRVLTAAQKEALEALSRQVMAHLDLRRAMMTLRGAEEAKKKFVANVSHELRTPLTSIRGALALTLDGDPSLDADSRDLLAAAYRSANRLLALVNDLLDLEKVGSGELSVTKADCSLASVLERAADTIRPIAADQGLTLSIGAADVRLHGDAERLAQVVINLLANAVRFSPKAGRITVTVEPHGDHVHIIIDDQGPGVPLAYRDTVFEPFKQVEGSAAHKKGGTGLGLAISHAIVREHGGWIVVGDAPSGGARFTIGLPVTS
ncbi:MAG TPA: GAF domain-containing sensor histidine kinase [Vicinamibacterales bacterium]|nr:GAF domain-containing sensor histidine kinase [Vicinamibacterales bacterium]